MFRTSWVLPDEVPEHRRSIRRHMWVTLFWKPSLTFFNFIYFLTHIRNIKYLEASNTYIFSIQRKLYFF
jgi:hypothetical protein